MNKKPKNIEQLYSESFSDFRIEPSSGLWKKISTKLAWRNFFSFTPTTLNAYYVAGLLTLATAGVLWITKPAIEINQKTKEIIIYNTIEKPIITTVQKTQEKTQQPVTSIKAKGKRQKAKVKEEEQKSNKDMNSALSAEALAKADLSTEVSTKEDSSAIVTTKADLSTVVSTKVDNVKLKSGINDQSNQQPATSNQQPVTPKALFDIYPPNPVLPTDPISFINLSKNAVRYEWHFGDSETSTEFEPVHFYKKANNYNIKLRVWSEDGSVDSLVISYNFTNSAYKIEFPNAFTPNSNGPTNGYYTPGVPNNDVFHPEYKGIVEYHLRIFNRRGELIFESNEINVGWDGYINDRLAAQGVYVWKARGKYSNGQNFIKAGNVILIKK